MLPSALAFLSGDLLFQQLPRLPSPVWLLTAIPLGLLALRFPLLRLPFLVAGGFLWSWLHLLATAPPFLPETALNKTVVAEGRILGVPRCGRQRCIFYFGVERIRLAGRSWQGSWRVRLARYGGGPQLVSGDRWRLPVKLRPVIGYRNPGGFDYPGWLHARGVRYSGYIRGEGRLLASGGWSLDRLRQAISARIQQRVTSPRAAAVMRALVVGDRGDGTLCCIRAEIACRSRSRFHPPDANNRPSPLI